MTAPEIFGHDAEVIYGGDRNRGVIAIPERFYPDLDDAVGGCPTGAVRVSNRPFA